MKLTFRRITASAEQGDLVKALKKIEKLVSEVSFSDTSSTMDSDYITLVYYASCSQEQYPELGQEVLKIAKSVKDWSCTTQFVAKENSIQIKFITKIGF